MSKEKISAAFPYTSKFVDVYGSKMHYIEEGVGDPILFLHGMPASSYVWRNVIPYISNLGRCIAPDFIGMGKSDKPDIPYTISDHIKYLEKFIQTLNLKNVTLVMHGFGSIIGFNYATQHENNCKALVFYEPFLRPFDENGVSLPFLEQWMVLQDQENISDLILNSTFYVDKVLPQEMMRELTEEEKNYYREPFLQKGAGKPLYQFLQELSCDNRKTEADVIIKSYLEKLEKSSLPKLMLYSMPGFVTSISTVMWAKENLPNLELAEIGEALHYAQESDPFLMGETISVWLQGVEQTSV